MLKKLINENVGNNWDDIIYEAMTLPEMVRFRKRLSYEKTFRQILPEHNSVLNAFKYTDYNDVKVVILGQDPYHSIIDGKSVAHGLSFSSAVENYTPPSLRNIFKELQNDIGTIRTNPNLTDWAEQGVLLLNTALTVVQGMPGIHAKGWKPFTKHILSNLPENLIYILWGNHAINMQQYLPKGIYIKSVHPSPLSASRGFFGSSPFSKVNSHLTTKIIW